MATMLLQVNKRALAHFAVLCFVDGGSPAGPHEERGRRALFYLIYSSTQPAVPWPHDEARREKVREKAEVVESLTRDASVQARVDHVWAKTAVRVWFVSLSALSLYFFLALRLGPAPPAIWSPFKLET